MALVAIVTGLVVACSSDPPLLEYTTLFEDSRGDGGIQREILVKEGASQEEVVSLLEYIRDETYPEGWLEVRVFDSEEVWDANRSCLMAWKGWPLDRGGVAPECEESKLIGSENPFVGSLDRHPELDYDAISWWGSQN